MTDNNHIGFDNERYLREQTAAILDRVNRFNNKLYDIRHRKTAILRLEAAREDIRKPINKMS